MNKQHFTIELDSNDDLLRDYFAGLAMCNAVPWPLRAPNPVPEVWMPCLAQLSYRLADEMLKARAMTHEELCDDGWEDEPPASPTAN
jgi:hypothetical protein